MAEIKKKEKVADDHEEDVEGEDPEGKPNANTPEIVPAKLKHVDVKLKQATHGYFFNKATKFAEDREATEKEVVVKAARPKNKKNKPQNTAEAVRQDARWLDRAELLDEQFNREGRLVNIVEGKKNPKGTFFLRLPGQERKSRAQNKKSSCY